LRATTGAPVYMNSKDEELARHLDMQAAWLKIATPENPGIDVEAKEGDTLALGATCFQILETPGHSQGSISLYSAEQNMLIAGDTLFLDSIGRTDLPGGNSRQIISSIKNKLLTLPESTIVIPGHGSNTTIGREKHFNPFLS
jgi:hydroxyacylglutathione hydrolase